MASTNVKWDRSALGRVIGTCQEAADAMDEWGHEAEHWANAMAQGAEGGRYGGYPDGGILTHPEEPEYGYRRVMGRSSLSWVGFVHTENGAACADAVEHNTLGKIL